MYRCPTHRKACLTSICSAIPTDCATICPLFHITNASIVANQASGADCVVSVGSTSSYGKNLEYGTSCGFTGTGDIQNADPRLGPLANNGERP